MVIHCREAFEDTIAILKEEHIARAVFHCFDGSLDVAEGIWANGWLISFAATVSYPKNEELRRVVAACPSDRFMVETDAPFLPHQDVRGERNESCFLPRLVETISALKHLSMAEVARNSTIAAQTFFGLIPG